MGTVLILLASFFIGVIVGAYLIIAAGIYLVDKNAAIKQPETINARMKRVKELTQEQLTLQGGATGPQKNALHGRYKNGLNGRIKELEQEKNDILRSILTDGFDPAITAQDETGVVHTIKLSEFMAQNGITMTPKPTPVAPTPRQVGKFTVHKGGKDDGDGSTFH